MSSDLSQKVIIRSWAWGKRNQKEKKMKFGWDGNNLRLVLLGGCAYIWQLSKFFFLNDLNLFSLLYVNLTLTSQKCWVWNNTKAKTLSRRYVNNHRAYEYVCKLTGNQGFLVNAIIWRISLSTRLVRMKNEW